MAVRWRWLTAFQLRIDLNDFPVAGLQALLPKFKEQSFR